MGMVLMSKGLMRCFLGPLILPMSFHRKGHHHQDVAVSDLTISIPITITITSFQVLESLAVIRVLIQSKKRPISAVVYV